jgi:hypothetical protein
MFPATDHASLLKSLRRCFDYLLLKSEVSPIYLKKKKAINNIWDLFKPFIA